MDPKGCTREEGLVTDRMLIQLNTRPCADSIVQFWGLAIFIISLNVLVTIAQTRVYFFRLQSMASSTRRRTFSITYILDIVFMIVCSTLLILTGFNITNSSSPTPLVLFALALFCKIIGHILATAKLVQYSERMIPKAVRSKNSSMLSKNRIQKGLYIAMSISGIFVPPCIFIFGVFNFETNVDQWITLYSFFDTGFWGISSILVIRQTYLLTSYMESVLHSGGTGKHSQQPLEENSLHKLIRKTSRALWVRSIAWAVAYAVVATMSLLTAIRVLSLTYKVILVHYSMGILVTLVGTIAQYPRVNNNIRSTKPDGGVGGGQVRNSADVLIQNNKKSGEPKQQNLKKLNGGEFIMPFHSERVGTAGHGGGVVVNSVNYDGNNFETVVLSQEPLFSSVVSPSETHYDDTHVNQFDENEDTFSPVQ